MRWITGPIDRIRRSLAGHPREVPREALSLRPIGVVRNAIADPMPSGWGEIRSDLAFRDDLTDALDGIEAYSHIIVVFACHLVPDDERRDTRFRPADGPEQGVLATRSQLRPNGLATSVVPLLRRRGNVLRVRGLDAVDGTPVLDVKPYLPQYDSVPDATVPEWARRAQDGGGDVTPSP